MKCLLAAIAILSVGCDMSPVPETQATPAALPAKPGPKPGPNPTDKQLITTTTKSPEAKAAFLKSWELSDNGRNEEALGECKVAIAADPGFALAHTCAGNLMPGAAAQAELDTGARLAAKLPDAERLLAEAFAAQRRQEMDKYYADITRVAELAPDDFHAQVLLGNADLDRRDFAAAAAAYKKALALNPAASFVEGSLATVYTQLRKYEDALAAAKRYVEARPTRPAPTRPSPAPCST
jgi:eukaryotic-like serine/threonine-protein kinase